MTPRLRSSLVLGSGTIGVLSWVYFILMIYPVATNNDFLRDVTEQWPARFAAYYADEKRRQVLANEFARVNISRTQHLGQFTEFQSPSDAHAEIVRLAITYRVTLSEVRHPETTPVNFIFGVLCFGLPLTLSATWSDYLVFRNEIIKRAPFIEYESIRSKPSGHLQAEMRLSWCRRKEMQNPSQRHATQTQTQSQRDS